MSHETKMIKLKRDECREMQKLMDERAKKGKQLPSQKELRRQLGIDLIEAERNKK